MLTINKSIIFKGKKTYKTVALWDLISTFEKYSKEILNF